MKISLNWLKDFIELKETDPQKISDILTDSAAEVEEFHVQSKGLEKVFVGEILEIHAHPDADKMRVTKVQVGKEVLQIVCGAKNICEGMKVPVALAGSVLPGDFEIKKADKRGVESCGMICSESELGISDESEGIMGLDKMALSGESIVEYLGLDDVIFEIENTTITNRPDLFSHIGFAREFVALGLAQNVEGSSKSKGHQSRGGGNPFPLKFNIESKDLASRICGAEIKNFKIAPSPKWMQKRLIACDIRPINNLVDITNYVMLEQGMPMHAFDLESIEGESITLRSSKKGEKVTTLDKVERVLPENVIILEDKKKVFDLCGIMGGESSGVKNTTSHVWLHSPVYDPIRIRRASITLSHRSDASVIYEKRVPNSSAKVGLIRALELMQELCPEAEIASELLDIDNEPSKERSIELRLEKVYRVLGEEISEERIKEILEALGFTCHSREGGNPVLQNKGVEAIHKQEIDSDNGLLQKKCHAEPVEADIFSSQRQKGEVLLIKVPDFRFKDIQIEEDLIEEIIRIYGLSNIQMELPDIKMDFSESIPSFPLEQKIKNILAQHAHETIHYSFLGLDLLEKIGEEKMPKRIEILNPLGEEHRYMRSSLAPYLLGSIAKNSRHEEKFALYEFGKVFHLNENRQVQETKHLAYASYDSSFYETKEVLQQLFQEIDMKIQLKEAKEIPKYSHPGQVAEIHFQGKKIGFISSIHPKILKNFDIQKPLAYFEWNFDALAHAKRKPKQHLSVNKFPSISRDQNFILDRKILAEDFMKKIQKGVAHLSSLEIKDIYEGEHIPEGKKCVTIHAVYQSDSETLTDSQVEGIHKKLVENAVSFGGELR
jgi:phenylalanyl-tRNA synthetase beta chain